MREIKFRAWLKNENRMIYGKDATASAIFTNGFRYRSSEVETMQYTGTKDSKQTKEYPEGQEIYEGDLVKGISRVGGSFTTKKVTFLNGCFMFGNWNAHEYFNKHQFIEVIGNIYENPELLKY